MPVFTQQLKNLDPTKPVEALKAMERHIKYIQDQLEFTLMNLDSSNITEIETDKTNISSSTGSVTISSDAIALSGRNGEVFKAGYDSETNQFRFEVKGKSGVQSLYLNSNGELVITKNTNLSIDSGTWD